MAIVADTQLRMAEIYAQDLAADTHRHLQLLAQLRSDLALNARMDEGAYSAAAERLEAAVRTAETLLQQMDVQRELLKDLRATLAYLRKAITGGPHTDAGPRPPLPES
jgi:hypothetical protein